MIRLSRYLRPFIITVGIAVGLLFLQAIADLSLPHYTGNIVNVGIQQGGIENAVPLCWLPIRCTIRPPPAMS